MKKKLFLIVVLATTIAISGCITVEKVVRKRVDQKPSGNKGYVGGQAPRGSFVTKSATREYIDVRIEIPTMVEFKERVIWPEEPRDVSTTREGVATIERPSRRPSRVYAPAPPAPIEEVRRATLHKEPVLHKEPALYKVIEGDSLGSIAKKFYGKAGKWTLVYEANMDKIKDPQRIKPGTELVIPRLEEETEYIK